MDHVLFSLLGLGIGILIGSGAAKLVTVAVPLLQQVSPFPIEDGPAALILLAVVGAAVGIIIELIFGHASVLLGALVSLLYFVPAILRPRS